MRRNLAQAHLERRVHDEDHLVAGVLLEIQTERLRSVRRVDVEKAILLVFEAVEDITRRVLQGSIFRAEERLVEAYWLE